MRIATAVAGHTIGAGIQWRALACASLYRVTEHKCLFLNNFLECPMKLYFHPVSTVSRPVMLFAADEGIALETQLVDL
jgi:hypothetical protein